jgi:hypothetical protein
MLLQTSKNPSSLNYHELLMKNRIAGRQFNSRLMSGKYIHFFGFSFHQIAQTAIQKDRLESIKGLKKYFF